jgi:hypothetical protein
MSKYKFLNLNPRGLLEDDCVCRAITFATGLPYNTVYEKLWLTADLYDCDRLCKYCYSNFLRNVLGYREVNCDRLNIGEFADKHPHGTYLIRIANHLTVIRDGTLYDTFDCRKEICDIVWKRVD